MHAEHAIGRFLHGSLARACRVMAVVRWQKSLMDTIDWETVRNEFAFDGSWRDIYILGTTISDWQCLLDAIRVSGYRPTYFRDETPTEIPATAEDAFPLPDQANRRLALWFADVLANCHFFTVTEIEFDIDPREVKGQHELNALFDFMRWLSHATEKEVVLTAENMREIVIFRVAPGIAAIDYHPFGGWHDWRK